MSSIKTGIKSFNSNVYDNFFFLCKKIIEAIQIKNITDEMIEDFNLYDHQSLDFIIEKIEEISDDEICASMVILQEEAKLAIEPAAAACLAAILGPLKEMVQGKNVGLVMCGANIDSQSYSKLLRQGRDYKIKNQWNHNLWKESLLRISYQVEKFIVSRMLEILQEKVA